MSKIGEIVEHTKRTWSDVGHGKASLAEYAEVGVEAVAAAAAVVLLKGKLSEMWPSAKALLGEGPCTVNANHHLMESLREAARDMRPATKTLLDAEGHPIAGLGLKEAPLPMLLGDRSAALRGVAKYLEHEPTALAPQTLDILGVHPTINEATVRGLSRYMVQAESAVVKPATEALLANGIPIKSAGVTRITAAARVAAMRTAHF